MEPNREKGPRVERSRGWLDFFSFFVVRTILLGVVTLVLFLAAVFVLGNQLLGFGPQTMWINLHYATFIVMLFAVMFLLDLVYLSKHVSRMRVDWMKITSVYLFIILVLVVILGIVPDIPFDTAHVAGSWSSAYGGFSANVTDAGVGNFTGPSCST